MRGLKGDNNKRIGCKLFKRFQKGDHVSLLIDDIVVGEGEVFQAKSGEMLHNRRLSEGYVGILVHACHDNVVQLPIPNENAAMYTLCDAMKSCIAWPIDKLKKSSLASKDDATNPTTQGKPLESAVVEQHDILPSQSTMIVEKGRAGSTKRKMTPRGATKQKNIRSQSSYIVDEDDEGDQEDEEVGHFISYNRKLQLDLLQIVMDRLQVSKSTPPPPIPLCRLIPNVTIRQSGDRYKQLCHEFSKHGYVRQKGHFICSLKTPLNEERNIDSFVSGWDPIWRQINTEFEKELIKNNDWSFLSNKMLYVWDGNHRLRAFMEEIVKHVLRDPTLYPRVDINIIEIGEHDEGELLSALARLNRLNENDFIKTTISDKVCMIRALGQSDKASLLKHVPEQDKKYMAEKLAAENNKGTFKAWYKFPLGVLSQVVFQDVYHFELRSILEKKNVIPLANYEIEWATTFHAVDLKCRRQTRKLATLANPTNGDKFYNVVLRVDWEHRPPSVTEERLYNIACTKLSQDRKANIARALTEENDAFRKQHYIPTDNKTFRVYLVKEVLWDQIIDAGIAILRNMEANYGLRFSVTGFSLYSREYKRKYFPKLFLEMVGKSRSSYDPDRQPGLALTACRVVFRWLSAQVNTKSLEYMPPMALEWCDLAKNDCMYTSLIKESKWSSWVFEHCPWWLDFPMGEYPPDEKEDFLRESMLLKKELETMILLDRSKKPREVITTKTYPPSSREAGGKLHHILLSESSSDTEPSSSNQSQENDDVDKSYVSFDVQETVVNLINESCFTLGSRLMENDVLHGVFRLESAVRLAWQGPALLHIDGEEAKHASPLVIAILPNGLLVSGMSPNVPSWNEFNSEMMQSMFALTKRVLADEGYFIVIHTKNEMFGLREYAEYEHLTYINSQAILCSTAAVYDMNEEVHILHMSRFKRDTKEGGRYNIENFQGLRSNRWTPFRDYVEDNIKHSEWKFDLSGQPWRGGMQRGQSLMNYIVRLFSNPGDVIVDFTTGTGTLLHEATSLRRSVVGLENQTDLYKWLVSYWGKPKV